MASQRDVGLNNSRESVTSRSVTTEGQVSQGKVDLSVCFQADRQFYLPLM